MRMKKETLFWSALGLYFLFFLLLNFITPLVSDDYRYAYSFATDQRITSVWQIFPSLYEHYFTMHGRTAVHFFAQLFMLLGKPVFNVLNAAMAVLLLLGLYRLSMGRGAEKRPAVLLGLGAAAFLFTPAFGQTMLWLDGACNYLWGITITVWVLVPFRDAFLNEKRAQPPFRDALRNEKRANPSFKDVLRNEKWAQPPWVLAALFLGSLFMGAASENSSPAALLLMLAITIILWKKSGRLRPWMGISCGLAAAGFLILVLSPANAIRSANYAAEGVSRMGQILLNFQAAAQTLLLNGLPLACAFLALFVLAAVHKADRQRLELAALLFLAGLAANFAMTLSNGYPLRAMMGCAVFMLAGIGVLLPDVLKGPLRAIAAAAVACAVFAALITALTILPLNYNRFAEANARVQYVTGQKELGNLNVTTYTLEGKTPYDVFFDITDISFDETYWPNTYYARYYGVETVGTDVIR